MAMKEKGRIRSCRSLMASVLMDPNDLKMPTFRAGNKNVTQKIRKMKFMYPSSFNGSRAIGKVKASKPKR
jgi:hypothetical protein